LLVGVTERYDAAETSDSFGSRVNKDESEENGNILATAKYAI
jgi:hypothetical protein